jgi:hypothetical protein
MRLTLTAGQVVYESLYDWLTTEPDLRPVVGLEKRPPRIGELGSVIDALTIAVDSGGTLTILAGALRAWLGRERNRGARLEITDRPKGGRKIVLDARNTSAADIERILRALTDGTD